MDISVQLMIDDLFWGNTATTASVSFLFRKHRDASKSSCGEIIASKILQAGSMLTMARSGIATMDNINCMMDDSIAYCTKQA